jgi:chromosome segregation ATPase
MTARAPVFRSVDALSGDVAESPVLKILDTADEIAGQAAECERLAAENAALRARLISLSYAEDDDETQLRARVDRLTHDNAKLVEQADGLAQANESLTSDRDGYRESAKDLSTVLQSAFADIESVRDERDEALIRADELHQSLNDARAEVVRLQRLLEQTRTVEPWSGKTSGGLK